MDECIQVIITAVTNSEAGQAREGYFRGGLSDKGGMCGDQKDLRE